MANSPEEIKFIQKCSPDSFDKCYTAKILFGTPLGQAILKILVYAHFKLEPYLIEMAWNQFEKECSKENIEVKGCDKNNLNEIKINLLKINLPVTLLMFLYTIKLDQFFGSNLLLEEYTRSKFGNSSDYVETQTCVVKLYESGDAVKIVSPKYNKLHKNVYPSYFQEELETVKMVINSCQKSLSDGNSTLNQVMAEIKVDEFDSVTDKPLRNLLRKKYGGIFVMKRYRDLDKSYFANPKNLLMLLWMQSEIHSHGLCNPDLKPNNLAIDEKERLVFIDLPQFFKIGYFKEENLRNLDTLGTFPVVNELAFGDTNKYLAHKAILTVIANVGRHLDTPKFTFQASIHWDLPESITMEIRKKRCVEALNKLSKRGFITDDYCNVLIDVLDKAMTLEDTILSVQGCIGKKSKAKENTLTSSPKSVIFFTPVNN